MQQDFGHGSGRLMEKAEGRRFRQRTESTRERDVHRHLQCWSAIYRPAALHRSPFPPIGDHEMPTPGPCGDTALVAFAQLCALRLHARRCLVTLISSQTEYVLVEATRSTSLQYDSVDDPKDDPWIGTCSFPRDDGINVLSMDGWRKARRLREPPTDADHYYTEGQSGHWSIACDVRSNEQYGERPFVQRAPGARFYFAVPLRSAQGSVLGSVVVLDDKPRYGVSAVEMSLVEDIADTVSQHLDATVVRAARERSERLIQGLGLFNNGKDSLRDWWQQQEDCRVSNTGRYANKTISDGQRQARQDQEFGTVEPVSVHDFAGQNATARQTMRTGDDKVDAVPNSEASGQSDRFGKDVDSRANRRPQRRSAPRRRSRTRGKPGETAAFDLTSSVERTYARESNLIREALGAEGVVFVDANIVANLRRSGSGADSDEHLQRSSSGEGNKSSASEPDGLDVGSGGNPLCKAQGISTRSTLTASSAPTPVQRFDLTQALLSRLMCRYRKGRIFNFRENGDPYTSSGEDRLTSGSSDAASAKGKRFPKDAQHLAKVMVGARTIAFYPLWDDTLDRWRSGIFVWSNSPLRYFDQAEDITYLSAWGHSLVAELSRLETIAADKAKGAFISSVSHELRSPLHGVLAGVEFLLESELSPFQQEMTHTISTAGRVLLDT